MKYAVLLYVPYENVGLSLEKDIQLWLKNFPLNWKTTFDINNNDLSILTALLLQKNWKGNLTVKVAIENNEEDLQMLNDLVRFPVSSKIEAYQLNVENELLKKSSTDLNIMGYPDTKGISDLIELVNTTRTSALFCIDSSSENALV